MVNKTSNTEKVSIVISELPPPKPELEFENFNYIILKEVRKFDISILNEKGLQRDSECPKIEVNRINSMPMPVPEEEYNYDDCISIIETNLKSYIRKDTESQIKYLKYSESIYIWCKAMLQHPNLELEKFIQFLDFFSLSVQKKLKKMPDMSSPSTKAIIFVTISHICKILKWIEEKLEKIKRTQPSAIDEIIDEIKNDKNLFIKGMPMEKVIEHFRPLTVEKSKNGNPFLTTEQLTIFLQRAFLNKVDLPKQEINYEKREKGFVISRFYEFFNYCVKEHLELDSKEKYIQLILNNFETNWTYSSVYSLFKPNKAKRKW